jgi:plasmid stabilization system protein ParE
VAAANVTFHPGASEDYAAAYCWYYDRGPMLAANFESEVERGVRLISQNPSRWPKFDNRRRRFIVRKFPYSIIYELHGEEDCSRRRSRQTAPQLLAKTQLDLNGHLFVTHCA